MVVVEPPSPVRHFVTRGTVAQAPLSMGFPKNTEVSCYSLLQGIFLTQGSNPHLLHGQVRSLPQSHRGNPMVEVPSLKTPSPAKQEWAGFVGVACAPQCKLLSVQLCGGGERRTQGFVVSSQALQQSWTGVVALGIRALPDTPLQLFPVPPWLTLLPDGSHSPWTSPSRGAPPLGLHHPH